jgi:hypothetical protein
MSYWTFTNIFEEEGPATTPPSWEGDQPHGKRLHPGRVGRRSTLVTSNGKRVVVTGMGMIFD